MPTPAANNMIGQEPVTTVSAFVPFYDPGNVYASVVNVKSDVTTYQLFCTPSDEEDAWPNPCTDSKGVPFTQGPSTMSMSYSFTKPNTMGLLMYDYDCTLYPKRDGIECALTQVHSDTRSPELGTETYVNRVSTNGAHDLMMPLTITDGADKLYGTSTQWAQSAEVASTATGHASSTTGTGKFAPVHSTSGFGSLATAVVSPTRSGSGVDSVPTSELQLESASSLAPSRLANSTTAAATPSQTDSGAGNISVRNAFVAGMAFFSGVMMLL